MPVFSFVLFYHLIKDPSFPALELTSPLLYHDKTSPVPINQSIKFYLLCALAKRCTRLSSKTSTIYKNI